MFMLNEPQYILTDQYGRDVYYDWFKKQYFYVFKETKVSNIYIILRRNVNEKNFEIWDTNGGGGFHLTAATDKAKQSAAAYPSHEFIVAEFVSGYKTNSVVETSYR